MALRLGAAAASAVVLLAGAGCSKKSTNEAAAKCESTTTTVAGAPAPPGAPAGSVLVDVKAEGFSLAVPSTWRQVVIDNQTVQRLVNEANQKVSGTQKVVNDQVRTLIGRGGKLFAFDTCSGTTNLSVVKSEVRGVTLERVAQVIPPQFTGQGMRDVKAETVTIAAGLAVKVTAIQPYKRSDGKQVDLFQLQYYVLSAPQGAEKVSQQFVLTLTTDDPGRDQAGLEAIGQTFKAA